MHIPSKSELKEKKIKAQTNKNATVETNFFFFFLKKLLKAKIKPQVAFRQEKLPFTENTHNTFLPQELLGTTLKLDPVLH